MEEGSKERDARSGMQGAGCKEWGVGSRKVEARGGKWESEKLGKRESGKAGKWESGKAGKQESGKAGKW